MAIDTKTLRVWLWKLVSFSMQICFDFVSKYPVFSSVTLFLFLLYIFLPTVFIFLVYSLLIIIPAVVFYRVFYSGDHKSNENVKSCQKNDDNSTNMGTNRSILDDSQAARPNDKGKDKEECMQTSSTEDKYKVCFAKSSDGMVDKSAAEEENVKDIEEVKIDSVADGEECSSCKDNECGKSQDNVDCGEGSTIYSGRNTTSSGNSEDSGDDRDKAVSGTDDDQQSHMDPGHADIDRSRRLESMIARRKARKLFSFQVRHTLMNTGNDDPVEQIASILVPRGNPLASNNSNDRCSPGSAPSVLLPMHNPFDIPYETHEERPNLTDESFQEEFLAENKDLMLCKHESFRWGSLFSIDNLGDLNDIDDDVPFKPRAPQKLKTPILGSHLEDKDVEDVSKNKSCQQKEAISNGFIAEDHATQECQASQQAPASVNIHHEEDNPDIQKKGMEDENDSDGSSSSSSSEESLPVCRPNKDAILRSLTSLRRNSVLPKDDDDFEVNSFTHESDQSIFCNNKTDGQFFFSARDNHARSNSLASDMLVEVSEISSPRSIPSLDEEGSVHGEDMRPENNLASEEIRDIYSHPSQVDTGHESNSAVVPESRDHQNIVGRESRINYNANNITSDVRPDNVIERNHMCHSKDSNIEDMPDSSDKEKNSKGNEIIHQQSDFKQDLPYSSEKEKDNRGNDTIHKLSDSKTRTNDYLEKSDTENNMENETTETSNLPESSRESNFESINHQSLSESSIQNQHNKRRESRDSFSDYDGESEHQPSANNLADNPSSSQSDHSSRLPENRRDEHTVSEVEFPASSDANESSGVVPETETEQVPIISGSGSPKSVLQPKFLNDQVSLTDNSRGTSPEHQQSNNQAVDSDSMPEVPQVNLNHSARKNASPRPEDSPSQSHDIERYQSPRFQDALSCVPFRPKLNECQNYDASSPTSSSRFFQKVHDPYPHQSNFNQHADTSKHIDDSVVNESRANLESIEKSEGEINNKSTKQDTAAVYMEPSNSTSLKSTEDTKEGTREIDGQEGAFGTSKATEGDAKSEPDVNLQEFQEPKVDDVVNQPKAADSKDNSLSNNQLEPVLDQNHIDSTDSTRNLVAHADKMEHLDPSLENTLGESNN